MRITFTTPIFLGLGCFAMLLTGCPGAYFGGGTGTSTMDGGKVTIAFSGDARDLDNDGLADSVRGQLQFKDHANGVAFHGVLLDAGVVGITRGKFDENGNRVLSQNAMIGTGTYTPIPRNAGEGGTFELILADFGQPGPDEGDGVTIFLSGGVYDGYLNDVIIENGNLHLRD